MKHFFFIPFGNQSKNRFTWQGTGKFMKKKIKKLKDIAQPCLSSRYLNLTNKLFYRV